MPSMKTSNQTVPGFNVPAERLRILHLEAVANDALLVDKTLQKASLFYETLVVNVGDRFLQSIKDFSPDIILADQAGAAFNFMDAFLLCQENNVQISFIIITDPSNEALALEVLSKGADDYIFKDRLNRLPLSIYQATERFRLKNDQQNYLDKLVTEQKRYKALVENSTDGIAVLSAEGNATYVSKSVSRILGYTEAEAMQLNLFALMHPEDRAGTAERMQVCINTPAQPLERVQSRIKHKDGSWRWMEATMTNMLHDPVVNGIVDNFRDITDKKNTEDLLQKTNKLARIGNYEIDLLTNKLYWSATTKQIHEVAEDYEPEVATALNFYKSGNSLDRITLAVKEAIANGQTFDLELIIITANNKECWVRSIGDTDVIDGKCVRLYGSFQDINERKKAEIELLKVYEEKNVILDSIGDSFFAIDKDWMVTYWNKEAEKVLLTPKSKILGYPLWNIFPKGIGSLPHKKYQEAMDTQKVITLEHYYSELQKWFEISAYPSAAGLSVFLKDVTERKLAGIQLSALNLQLIKNVHDLAMSNKELEDFAYVASHDLQEPLRMVSSFLGLLEKKYIGIIDEKGKQYINFAVDGANRMRQIILDLLDFSKVGKEDYEQESVDLNLIVKEVIFLSQNQVTDTEATINFSKLPTLTAYKTPLRQVIQNLISNSLKYHRTGVPPVINLSAIEFETYWQFEVSDNGIGIEKEYFDKVFLIFKRLHRPGEYSGNGIGLAVCKKIVENFGGRIWLESEVSKATSFYFTLPKK